MQHLEYLTAEDIALVTATPLRTARARLARWRRKGGRALRIVRAGVRGPRPWAIPLDAWCQSRALDPREVLATLGRHAATAEDDRLPQAA